MTDFKKLGLKPCSLEPTKWNVLVTYGRNSVCDLARSNDVARNAVNERIGNKTWCKCDWYAAMETSIEGVCCLEIPEICKPIFSSASSLYVCRSHLHFAPWCSKLSYLISYFIWFPWKIRIKVFLLVQTLQLSFSVKHFSLLIGLFSL